MGILDSVERGLERAVNGAFARTFRSGVQPVEIAAGLKRELDIGSVVVDRDRVLAPNHFVVRVAGADADRLTGMGANLERELIDVVTKHAKRQGYQLLGAADVELRRDDSLTTGVLQIDAAQVEGSVSWVPMIEVEGVQHPLRNGATIVGRGSDADIRLSDSAASRQHLQLIWDGKAGIARDLGSTNGTKINGQRFREAALSPDTVLTIGQTALRFQLVPSRHAANATGAGRRAQAVRPEQQQQQQQKQQPRSSKSQQQQASQPQQAPQQPRNQNGSNHTSNPNQAEQPGIEQDFWRGL